MTYKLYFLSLLCSISLFSQNSNFTAKEVDINKNIQGTLLIPNNIEASNLVIILAGSGPTDRNGNQNFAKNNVLKKVAEALSNNGVATYRYDKRIIKQILANNIDPNLIFDDFVTDAIATLQFFKSQNTYKKIFIAGHSQGSLIGILAAKEGADGFISIAGAGRSIDQVITEQISLTAPQFSDDTKRIFKIIKTGKTTNDYPPQLTSLFDKSIQSFMANWMQYSPKEEIKKLDMPTLIINGTRDLQVTIDEANLLDQAAKNSKILIVENMNHVLTTINNDDRLENVKSYNEPSRKLSQEVIHAILEFVK